MNMNLNKEILFEEGRMYEIGSDFYISYYTKFENKVLKSHGFSTTPSPSESKTILFLKTVYINGNHVIKLEPGKNRTEYIECLYDSKKIYLQRYDLNCYCKIRVIPELT